MALFDEKLADKPQIVTLNKIDLPMVSEKLAEIQAGFKKLGVTIFPISAVAQTNVKELMWQVYDVLQNAPEPAEVAELPVYRMEEDPRAFRIEEEEFGWRVVGKSIERSAAMTYWEHPGSLRRFQRLMNIIGLEKALRDAGIQEGDSVFIGDYELEWQD